MARPTKIGIPPGGTAGQVLIKSSNNDFAVEWGAGGDNGGGTNTAIPNGFIGKPYAVWSGSGLVFNCYTPVYWIQGVQYPSSTAQITLNTADPSNPRVDVIAVDSTGIIEIPGTASTPAVKPTVDFLTQLEITSIDIAAGATTPSGITNENVYLENTEWTGSSNVSGANFADTTSPFAGTKDVSIGAFTNGQYVRFVDSVTNNISDYSHLKFYVKLKAQFLSNTGFIITLKNGTTTVSSAFTVTNGVYNFDRTDISGYQLVAIPVSEFTFSSATFDTINFELKGNNNSGFYFDNIILQAGIVVITPGGGIVNSVVAGTNMTVDNTDPANPIVSSTGGGHTIQDEGTPLTQRTNLNFIGAGVAATDNPATGATDVTIPGASTPDASETVKGIAELATQAETNTGTDDLRIVTPLKLAGATNVVHSSGNETIAGVKTFSSFPEKSGTPTTNDQLVNKSYADSLIELDEYAFVIGSFNYTQRI